MSDMETDAYVQLFPTRHIPIILLSIVQAAGALRKKTPRNKEDWITRRLHKLLIRVSQFRDGLLDIRPQPEVPSLDPDTDTPAGRIDFLVSCGLGHEVYFAMEAKKVPVCGPQFIRDISCC